LFEVPSNHTGYGSWRGRVFDAGSIREVVAGIEDRRALAECDAVLSGYVGSAELGETILDAVARVKHANPAALYCCDPVIGDVAQGVFVRPDVAAFLRDRAVPAADIITPNQFELEYVTGEKTATLASALSAVRSAHALGPRIVLVTSLWTDETPADSLDLLVSDGRGRWRLRIPRLDVPANGAGDLIAALFVARCLENRMVADALSLSAASVFGILSAQHAKGMREMPLVAAQAQLAAPDRRFVPEPV
jgi:pyridoxine kinase